MDGGFAQLAAGKFQDPDRTAKGEPRAQVAFDRWRTLWFNTGTLCNITCANCYIESSPTNDSLVYLTPEDAAPFLADLQMLAAGSIEIGFTGGEPFMNPHMVALAEQALAAGHAALILTNAMKPMMRPKVRAGLLALKARYGGRLTLRVSLDHFTAEKHDAERGAGGFEKSCVGLSWLAREGFSIAIAGRSLWGEAEADAKAGYAALIAARGWPIDADDPARLMVFPEMDARVDVPEITPACWGILKVDPRAMMCASSRMVVKRKGAARAAVVACTLLPYDQRFELGARLQNALAPVALNHPHCAKFCVLGGGSCAA